MQGQLGPLSVLNYSDAATPIALRAQSSDNTIVIGDAFAFWRSFRCQLGFQLLDHIDMGNQELFANTRQLEV